MRDDSQSESLPYFNLRTIGGEYAHIISEFRSVSDALPRFDEMNATILGISPDSTKSHRKFKEKYDLPYALLADEDHKIAERYGVWGEKSMYGRKYMGILRTTFVIDAKGKIAKVFEKVKPEEHATEVAEAVAALNLR